MKKYPYLWFTIYDGIIDPEYVSNSRRNSIYKTLNSEEYIRAHKNVNSLIWVKSHVPIC